MYYSRESWGCSADMSLKETNEWCSSRTCVVAASLLFLRTLVESPQFSLVDQCPNQKLYDMID